MTKILGIHQKGADNDWVNFTPTGTWSTNTTYFGSKRRVGDSMEIDIVVELAGAPTSGALSIDIPDGLTVDTAKLSKTDGRSYVGSAFLVDQGTSSNRTMAHVFVLSGDAQLIGMLAIGGSTVTDTGPFTFANLDTIRITVTVPIVGWSTDDTTDI